MSQSQPTLTLRRGDIVLAYTFLRVIIGINFFNHGFTRIGNISGFVSGMVSTFQDTFMPTFLVQIMAFLVSPIELIFGLLLLLGLFTRLSLIVLLCLMFVLMYGVTLLQNWDTAGGQLIYDLILCLLLAGLAYNDFSLDARWRQRAAGTAAASTAEVGSSTMPFTTPGRRPRRRYGLLGKMRL